MSRRAEAWAVMGEDYDNVEVFTTDQECECGAELMIERGGGLISATCEMCGFSATCSSDEVPDAEWQQFLSVVETLEPEERPFFLIGAALGMLKGVAMFFFAIGLNAIDGGGKGLRI